MLHPQEDFGFDVKHALHCLHDIVNLGLYYPQNQDKALVDIIPWSGLLWLWLFTWFSQCQIIDWFCIH